MFNVKQSNAKELLEWVIACQQHDFYGGEIINTEGLCVDPVPKIKLRELDWRSSELTDPNSWRDKTSLFFGNLFK